MALFVWYSGHVYVWICQLIYYCVHALKIHSILIMSYAWCIPCYVQLCAFLRFFSAIFLPLGMRYSFCIFFYVRYSIYYEQLFCVQSHDKSQWYCLINTIALKPFFVGFMVMEAINAIDLIKKHRFNENHRFNKSQRFYKNHRFYYHFDFLLA